MKVFSSVRYKSDVIQLDQKVEDMLFKAILGIYAEKCSLSPNHGGWHLRSVLWLFSLGKILNHF